MKATLTSILLFFGLSIFSQNLVTDPSLEDTLKCPQSIGRFYHPSNTNEQYTAQWRSTTLASPDYHNSCGYDQFQARTGEGYAGILYYDPSEYREYISALLSQPMVAGECYYIEYYVALNANSTLAIDEVQVHFSAGVPLDLTWPISGALALTPHLQASTAPTSTGYQKISGFYTASGGEDVITFGNFEDNANTNTTTVSGVGSVNAYYYIDDVTITQLDLGTDITSLCLGDSALVTPNILCPTLTYTWSNGSSDTIAYVDSQGAFWLEISGNGSCAVSDTINVTLIDCNFDYPAAGFLNPNWPNAWITCVGECDTIYDASSANTVSREWDFGGSSTPNTSTAVNPYICYDSVGTFLVRLVATSGTGHTDTVVQQLIVHPIATVNAFSDTIIDLGGTAQLQAIGNSVGTYSWSPPATVNCPTCDSTSAVPDNSTHYVVQFTDDNGCIAIDTVLVETQFNESVGVPTAFSPNGDGQNEILYVKGNGFESIKFQVFNRYGQRVFETTDQSNGWDGSHRGSELNSGVYAWILDYEMQSGERGILKGNVTLVR